MCYNVILKNKLNDDWKVKFRKNRDTGSEDDSILRNDHRKIPLSDSDYLEFWIDAGYPTTYTKCFFTLSDNNLKVYTKSQVQPIVYCVKINPSEPSLLTNGQPGTTVEIGEDD